MRFGRWHALEGAAEHAPVGAGVYQVRLAHGLIDYPTGKSAMILYGAAGDLGRAACELAASHRGRAWLVRFAEDLDAREAASVDVLLAELVATFRRRFGAPPTLPP